MRHAAKAFILAAFVLMGLGAAERIASACAPVTFNGTWWYEYRQTPTSTPVVCGSPTQQCLHTVVYSEGCNGLQSYAYVKGTINWFGNGGPLYIIGAGKNGSPAWWLYPPESAEFYWYDGAAFRWNRFWNCQRIAGSGDWSCTHQQSDDGVTYGGSAVVTLHHIWSP
jgi:hypothetical protein